MFLSRNSGQRKEMAVLRSQGGAQLGWRDSAHSPESARGALHSLPLGAANNHKEHLRSGSPQPMPAWNACVQRALPRDLQLSWNKSNICASVPRAGVPN